MQLTSQRRGDVLGVGLQITKANDTDDRRLHLYAYEFEPAVGLRKIRRARDNEFPELNGGRRMSLTEQLRDYVLEAGMTTPTAAAEAINARRNKVSEILNNDSAFVFLKKDGKERYFGVRDARP